MLGSKQSLEQSRKSLQFFFWGEKVSKVVNEYTADMFQF